MVSRLVLYNDPTQILTGENIKGGVNYTYDINIGDEFSIGTAAAAEISFSYYNINNDASSLLGKKYIYQIKQDNDATWRSIGTFTIDSVDIGKTTAEVKAYDDIKKFDIYVDDWIENLTFPITLANMFSSLCTYCGCTATSYSGVNANFSIQDNFTGTNITGRQVLQYIVQAAAGYASVNPSTGYIIIKGYTSNATVINNTKYVSYDKASTPINKITKLQVKTTSDDIGVISGTGTNTYVIDNNPLFYADSPTEIQTAVDNIFNAIKNIQYTPGSIKLLQDWGIKCGDIITVNNNTFYVMRKSITGSSSSLDCIGKTNRETQTDNVNSAIVALRGKTNELTRTLDSTVSRLTTAEGDISTLEQTATSLTSRIENAEGDITTLEQTATSLTARIGTAEGDITTLEATTEGLTTTVAGKVGNNEVISKINQSAEAITIQANKLNLTGYITATDVGASGSTVIDGARISTGTISANRIGAGTITTDKLYVNGQSIGGTSTRLGTLYTDNVNFFYGGGSSGEIRYNLSKNGVEKYVSGTVTKSRDWEDIIDNAGGGSSYSAGTGISISSSNVISLYGVSGASTGQVLTKSSSGVSWTTPSATATFG